MDLLLILTPENRDSNLHVAGEKAGGAGQDPSGNLSLPKQVPKLRPRTGAVQVTTNPCRLLQSLLFWKTRPRPLTCPATSGPRFPRSERCPLGVWENGVIFSGSGHGFPPQQNQTSPAGSPTPPTPPFHKVTLGVQVTPAPFLLAHGGAVTPVLTHPSP